MSGSLDLLVPAADSLRAWRPEIALVATFLVAMPLSLFSRGRLSWLPRGATALGLFAASALAARGLATTGVLGNDFRVDATAALVRLVICAAALVVVLLGALNWRTPPGAREVPVRVHPFVALHALALSLLPQAHTLAGAVAAAMSATLGATLLLGLCARTSVARAAALRASLAAVAGTLIAVYGLSLRYPLAGSDALAPAATVNLAWALTIVLTSGGLVVACTALPALWNSGRGDGEGGLPGTMMGYLAGTPLLAVSLVVWRLGPAQLPATGSAWLLAATAALLATAIPGVLGPRPAATRLAWLGLSQAGYLLLALAATSAVGFAPFLRHLALVALGTLVALGLEHLEGSPWPALTRGVSRLFLVGLAGLPLLLVTTLWSANVSTLSLVAALGLIGSAGYLRLAFARRGA